MTDCWRTGSSPTRLDGEYSARARQRERDSYPSAVELACRDPISPQIPSIFGRFGGPLRCFIACIQLRGGVGGLAQVNKSAPRCSAVARTIYIQSERERTALSGRMEGYPNSQVVSSSSGHVAVPHIRMRECLRQSCPARAPPEPSCSVDTLPRVASRPISQASRRFTAYRGRNRGPGRTSSRMETNHRWRDGAMNKRDSMDGRRFALEIMGLLSAA